MLTAEEHKFVLAQGRKEGRNHEGKEELKGRKETGRKGRRKERNRGREEIKRRQGRERGGREKEKEMGERKVRPVFLACLEKHFVKCLQSTRHVSIPQN